MKQRIEFHDSTVSRVLEKGSTLEIHFKSFVTLSVKDEFGFEFDDGPSLPGRIVIANAKFKSLPTPGDVFDGHILQGEASYGLVPFDLVAHKPCGIFLSQKSGDHLIFGDKIEFFVGKI